VNVYIETPDFPYVFSYPDYEDLRDGTTTVFKGVSGSRLVLAQTDSGGSIEMLPGEAVTGNYFTLIGVGAAIGRTLLPEDDLHPGGHPVAMLSHDYWQSAYGGDRSAIGREIRLGGRPYSIIGVTPADYTGNFRGIEPSVYVPMMMMGELMPSDDDPLEDRNQHAIFVRARMADGVSAVQAQVATDAVTSRLTEQSTEGWDVDGRFIMIPSEDVVLYPPIDRFVRAAAWLLMVVVGMVLLLACMNLASFLLARALDRRKEIAVRLALGADRRSLVGQLMTETVMLAVFGGVAGLALAQGLLQLLLNADLPLPLPITLDLGLNMSVLGFNMLVSVVAGLILGLVPALQSTNPDLVTTLKGETAGGGQPGKQWLRNGLVVAQVAGSLVLLVGAALFLRSFQQVQAVDPGFGREPSAVMTVLIPSNRFNSDEGRIFVRTLAERIEGLHGVQAVGLIDNLHLNTMSTQTTGFNVDGVEPPPERDGHNADTAVVDPGFFAAAGIPLVRGRNFTATDLPDSPRVAIVSEAMARRFWTSTDAAIGGILRRGNSPDLTVVGVAADAKVRSLGESPRSFIYSAYSQSYSSAMTVIATTSLPPERLALEMVAAGKALDPDLWIWEAKSMTRHLGIMTLPARMSASLLAVFAGLALILTVIGLYGVVSYAVSRRTREVGIRISLGATHTMVIRTLMGGGLKLVAIGGAIGLVLSVALSRLLGGLLFGVESFDLVSFTLVPVVLLVATVLAAWIPARRATRIDPVSALRSE